MKKEEGVLELDDEQLKLLIATQLSGYLSNLDSLTGSGDYCVYLSFCVLGSLLKYQSPEQFDKAINEIKEKTE